MSWRKKLSFLSFTRNERAGSISLLVLIILFILIQHYVAGLAKPLWKPTEEDILAYVQSVEPNEPGSVSAEKGFAEKAKDTKKEAHFPFDPNTIDDEEWGQLGLSRKQIISLRKYMSFGYPFKKKEDLKKVYVLDSLWLDRHWDEIEIKKQKIKEAPEWKRDFKKEHATTKSEPIQVNINLADTLELTAVHGIGSYSARKIWKFREALGGFINLDQLGEVYGLREEAVQAIRAVSVLDSNALKSLSINQSNKEALAMHPYCTWKVAEAIVKYRDQHGPFTELDELKQIYIITDSIFVKLKPYLTVEHEPPRED
ncbi:MAG: DNA uptake protein ComE-like DNA-binding protein [Flavobacteriales bacterium]|jgi:competence protein ComEA